MTSQWPVTHGSFIIIEWINRVRVITLRHFGFEEKKHCLAEKASVLFC